MRREREAEGIKRLRVTFETRRTSEGEGEGEGREKRIPEREREMLDNYSGLHEYSAHAERTSLASASRSCRRELKLRTMARAVPSRAEENAPAQRSVRRSQAPHRRRDHRRAEERREDRENRSHRIASHREAGVESTRVESSGGRARLT